MRPAIFFDRDGVINERIVGGYVTEWSQFQFVSGIRAAMTTLSEIGLPVIVVSNQAGIGKGLLSRSVLGDITNRFVAALRLERARVDAVYYCPHAAEDGCWCRKPRIGLIRQAAAEWRIDLDRSVLIGDSPTDVEAANTAHCGAILLSPDGESSAGGRPWRDVAVTTVQKPSEIAGAVARHFRAHQQRDSRASR